MLTVLRLVLLLPLFRRVLRLRLPFVLAVLRWEVLLVFLREVVLRRLLFVFRLFGGMAVLLLRGIR